MSEKTKNILEWIYCIVIALVLALLFRFYIATPTIVQQRSMFPTLKENQRLVLNRTFRITGLNLERGDIVTFEAPSDDYEYGEAKQSNPVAKYEYTPISYFKKSFSVKLLICSLKLSLPKSLTSKPLSFNNFKIFS